MSIVEGILFYATRSEKCKNLLKNWNVIKDRLPEIFLNKIPLDTIELRKRVLNGDRFNITSVPTLVLLTDDGTIQVIENKEIDSIERVFDIMYRARLQHIESLQHNIPDDTVKDIEENIQDENNQQKERPSKLKFQPVSGSSDNTKNSQNVESITKPHKPLKSKQKTKGSSVAEIAAQMREAREASLGYRPDDVQ